MLKEFKMNANFFYFDLKNNKNKAIPVIVDDFISSIDATTKSAYLNKYVEVYGDQNYGLLGSICNLHEHIIHCIQEILRNTNSTLAGSFMKKTKIFFKNNQKNKYINEGKNQENWFDYSCIKTGRNNLLNNIKKMYSQNKNVFIYPHFSKIKG